MKMGKQLGMGMRFIYGYLKGFIIVSVVYITVALTIILFNPEPFSLGVVQYMKTAEYSKLKITMTGYAMMLCFGIYELILLQSEKGKKKKRRQIYE